MLAVQLPHDARPLDTIREAALHAKVSRRTIYNWMRDGKVDWVRTAGGSVRIYRDTLWRDKDDTPRSPRRLITMDLGLQVRLLPSRWLPLGWILRELRLLRKAQERIAVAMELANAHQWPQQIQRDPLTPVVEVSYVDDAQQELLMDIEARLTAARGQPPTEEEILIEYERRSPTPTASPSPYGDT